MHSRDKALDAAQALLNQDPMKSLAELAHGMGVARGTLYRHFVTREDLLHEIVERSVSRWEAAHVEVDILVALESDDPTLVANSIRALIRAYMTYPEDFGLTMFNHTLSLDTALRQREREVASREERLFKNGQRLRVLRSDVPTLWLSSTLWGLVIGARDARRDGDAAPSILCDLVLTTFLEGCADRGNRNVWAADRPPRF